jgi:3-deoxy-D-manno-octulosonic acid kinase
MKNADADALVCAKIDGFNCRLTRPMSRAHIRMIVDTLRCEPTTSRVLLGRRAGTFVHEIPELGAVAIKEYVRGGLVRRAIHRMHVRRGPTRPEREFEILRLAQAAGVPVPEPIAYLERGFVFYRGWLVTRLIEGGRTLAAMRHADPRLLARIVVDVGRQIDRLIANQIYHVDLHPGNVLVDTNNDPHLMDFDKAVLSTESADRLRSRYLARWRRAVVKHGLPELMLDGLSSILKEADP